MHTLLSIEILFPGSSVRIHADEAWDRAIPVRKSGDGPLLPSQEGGLPLDHGIAWNPTVDYGVFVDPRDGRHYRTVKIGKQTWFAENLAFHAQGSWVYGDNPANGEKYGRLYNWGAAKEACPPGWHLPSDEEWMGLEVAVGMGNATTRESSWRESNGEGYRLRSTADWIRDEGTDRFGFRALPGGFRGLDGAFDGIQAYANFWSSSPGRPGSAMVRYLRHIDGKVGRYEFGVLWGQSVRCVQDSSSR